MKQLSAPPQLDFDTYIGRPETEYCERETVDTLHKLYAQGYLPYSGAAGLQGIFYTARSARVVLEDFMPTSENRRIAKRFDGQFVKERISATLFVPNEQFWNLSLEYFRNKHGERAMPRERLETILASGLVSSVVVYRQGTLPVAYVLEVEDGNMGHFWFSFYDLSLAQKSLGLWLMLDCIRDAKAKDLAYYYLGTVYGEKALYKTNFEPLEWWDGTRWSTDIKTLKALSRV